MFYRPSPWYMVEETQQFGTKIVGFHMETGERRWYIVGCYLAPYDTSTIESVFAALKECPWGAELLVAEYLNINIEDPEGDQREEDNSEELKTTGLKDMSSHFLPRRRP